MNEKVRGYNFTFTYELDGIEIDCFCRMDPPEPSVGLMGPGVDWLIAIDADENEITLTDAQHEKLCDEAMSLCQMAWRDDE